MQAKPEQIPLTTMSGKLQLLTWAMISFAGYLQAQTDTMMMVKPIQTDRPTFTTSAFLVPKGHFQMEHGFSIEDTEPGFVYTYPSSLWKFGVSENFEFRVTTEYITVQKQPDPDINGFLPISVGFKSPLMKSSGIWPTVALSGALYFPDIGAAEFKTTYFAPSLRLLFHHDVSDFFALSYSGGADWDGETAEPNFFYSLITGFSITDRLKLFLEGYGTTPQREAGEIELRAHAGLTYLIGNNFLLDISAGQGITDNAPERFVSFGFSYRFQL
jgi:hypothetical protein